MRGRDIVVLQIGNSRSKGVYLSNDEIQIISTDSGSLTLSSEVSITDSTVYVGDVYVQDRYPCRTIRRAFRLLNRSIISPEAEEEMNLSSVPIVEDSEGRLALHIEGSEKEFYYPEDIIMEIVRALLKLCVQRSNETITRCALVIPDGYSQEDSNAFKAAVEKVGLKVECLMEESVCLGWYIKEEHQFDTASVAWDDGYILVYNMGCCGFSSSIIRRMDDKMLLASSMDLSLGGKQITRLIIEYMANTVQHRYKCDLLNGVEGSVTWVKEFNKLARSVDEALVCLHDTDEIEIEFPATCRRFIHKKRESEDEYMTVSRADVKRILDPFIRRSLNVCEMTLKKAGLRKDELFRVYPLGGCCYNPIIQNELKQYFGSGIVVYNYDMSTCSVKGLGYYVRDNLCTCLLIRNMI